MISFLGVQPSMREIVLDLSCNRRISSADVINLAHKMTKMKSL